MAYSALSTVITGDLWTAANHNLYLRDNLADHETRILGLEDNSASPLPVEAGIAPLSGLTAAALELVESSGAGTVKPVIYQLLFDASTDEGRMWIFQVPSSFSSTVDLLVKYKMASSNTSADVILQTQLAAISDGDTSVSAKVFASADSHTVSVPDTADELDIQTLSLTTLDSIAAGDWAILALWRDGDNGSDDASGDFQLLGLELRFDA